MKPKNPVEQWLSKKNVRAIANASLKQMSQHWEEPEKKLKRPKTLTRIIFGLYEYHSSLFNTDIQGLTRDMQILHELLERSAIGFEKLKREDKMFGVPNKKRRIR